MEDVKTTEDAGPTPPEPFSGGGGLSFLTKEDSARITSEILTTLDVMRQTFQETCWNIEESIRLNTQPRG